MELDVYVENQQQERSYAGPEPSWWLVELLPYAGSAGVLQNFGKPGDTVFEREDLRRLADELRLIESEHPQLAIATQRLTALLNDVIRKKGRLWIFRD